MKPNQPEPAKKPGTALAYTLEQLNTGLGGPPPSPRGEVFFGPFGMSLDELRKLPPVQGVDPDWSWTDRPAMTYPGAWSLPFRRDKLPVRANQFDAIIAALSGPFRDAYTQIMDGFKDIADAAQSAGLIDEQPPTDPRAHALWMKQHRGHGPEAPKNWRKR